MGEDSLTIALLYQNFDYCSCLYQLNLRKDSTTWFMANSVSDMSYIKLIIVSASGSHSCRLVYFNLPSYYSDVILFHDVSDTLICLLR